MLRAVPEATQALAIRPGTPVDAEFLSRADIAIVVPPADGEPDAELLDLAETLIEKKTGDFDASEFENRYIDALRGLIDEKIKKKGKRVIQDTAPDAPAKGSNVVDLMAALKKSLEGSDGGTKPAAKGKPAAKTSKPAAKSAPRKKAS